LIIENKGGRGGRQKIKGLKERENEEFKSPRRGKG
jgi:hypothetical protein